MEECPLVRPAAPQPSCEQLEVSSGNRGQSQLSQVCMVWQAGRALIVTGHGQQELLAEATFHIHKYVGWRAFQWPHVPTFKGSWDLGQMIRIRLWKKKNKRWSQSLLLSLSYLLGNHVSSYKGYNSKSCVSILWRWDLFCHKLGAVWDYVNCHKFVKSKRFLNILAPQQQHKDRRFPLHLRCLSVADSPYQEAQHFNIIFFFSIFS